MQDFFLIRITLFENYCYPSSIALNRAGREVCLCRGMEGNGIDIHNACSHGYLMDVRRYLETGGDIEKEKVCSALLPSLSFPCPARKNSTVRGLSLWSCPSGLSTHGERSLHKVSK